MCQPQPCRCRHLLLHALLMNNSHLSALLLSLLADTSLTSQITDSSISQTDSANTLTISQSEVVFFAMVDILARCSLFSASLSQALVPLTRRCSDWLMSQTTPLMSDVNKSQSTCPLWLRALVKQLDSFTAKVIKPGLEHLMKQQVPAAATPLLMKQLPCGCPLAGRQATTESEDPLIESIHVVISRLVADLHSLPLPLVILFRVMQDSLHDDDDADVASGSKSIVLKVLCTFICSFLYAGKSGTYIFCLVYVLLLDTTLSRTKNG